jgi:ribose transport system substrate-binding protein
MRASKTVALASVAFLAAHTANAEGKHVAIVTPFLSSVATHEMVADIQADPKAAAWTVTVIDTKGDMAAFADRIADEVQAHADAIVLVSVNPTQVQDSVNAAAKAKIPVFAVDGATAPGVVLNVTSDNFAMGKQLSDFLFGALGGKGNVVKFYFSAHPGVHARELALDDVLKTSPGIKILADHYVKVPGPMDDSRQAMENIIRSHPNQLDAVWAAWDEPAIGAVLALQSEGVTRKVLVAGIDGNPQAVEMIKACTPLIGTVKQDFATMAKLTVAAIADDFTGTPPAAPEVKVPALLVTRDTLGVHCD